MSDAALLAAIEVIVRGFEIAGIAAILLGAVAAAARYLGEVRRIGGEAAYHSLRSGLGRSILLGLELLVAADIINTVAVEPTMDNVLVLGAIVLIRTFLSLSLQVEIEGKWPWQRDGGAGH